MRRLTFTEQQFKVVRRALEVFITQEQRLADEQGLEVTADQEVAEGILDAIEDGLSPHDD